MDADPPSPNPSSNVPGVACGDLVVLLRERGPLTLTQIGESLWGGKRRRQSYARPAGAMVARMVKAGTVRQALSPDLGYKRNPLDPAKWMITSQHNDRHLAAAPEKPDPT